MSEKSVEDACNWVNETLSSAEIGSSGLPSSVQCSNVSTLSGICSQWDEFASITTIESKVDRLGSIDINQSKWLDAHNLTEMVDICWQ